MPFSSWLNILIADIIATVFTFIFSLILKNASVYDPYWSVQPIVILLAFATSVKMTPIKIATIITICVWGIRLTANWAYTKNASVRNLFGVLGSKFFCICPIALFFKYFPSIFDKKFLGSKFFYICLNLFGFPCCI